MGEVGSGQRTLGLELVGLAATQDTAETLGRDQSRSWKMYSLAALRT